ncbi:hypothetical protein [Mesorhizobium sp. M1B.F.Ca.ET.045.04.1.1]|uniref:hypothetical protein n=1 Tax=Mesorhizobium sp. M1B.F.Ca.ET.045.04.1.1 TaxID=2493673 RepID=UPI000F759639|nr:hypothetical protein [Mesorhizobium sp. M1B.F.Ca.ET.045.04.1.1]AZO30982.1 hypothetical protein EJ071_28710 [Mesorhizobium sp. M1B.F.Ca.ET.045.04.1.1]
MLGAIPDGKPLLTFPGIAILLGAIPDGKPLLTFPGIALAADQLDIDLSVPAMTGKLLSRC